jgi:hypothetical protein
MEITYAQETNTPKLEKSSNPMRRCRNDFTAVKITTPGAIANEWKSKDQASAELSNQACCPTEY